MLRRNPKRESEFAGPLEVSATWVHVGMNLGRLSFFLTLGSVHWHSLTLSLTKRELGLAASSRCWFRARRMLQQASSGCSGTRQHERRRHGCPKHPGEFTRACTILPIVYRVQFLFALYLLQRYILYCSGAHGSEPSSSKHEFRPTQEIRHVHPQDQGLLRPVE
jgi:hypothetical protein